MQPNATEAHDRSIVNNLIASLAAWWRQHANHGVCDNFAALSSEEIARIAQDVGLSASELRTLSGYCADAADLLDRRLSAVGLDPKELAHTVPAEMRDMERLCTLCRSKGRCARDLGADPDDPVWRQYCPNEATITQLSADRRRR